MLRIQRNKGITLIALVITIVVLLILAGVTISSLFGENSIIEKAKEAADKYNNAVKDEYQYMNFDNINKQNDDQGNTEEEEEIIETNPDFFTYSEPDANDDVLITGFTTGDGSGEEAYNNDDETVLKLVIPKQNSDGKNIKGIGWGAFENRNKITKLVLQDNIEQIGGNAFYGCTGLTTLTIPITINSAATDSYATIQGFGGCTDLSRVKLTQGKNGASVGFNYGTANWGTDWYLFTPWCSSFKNYQNKGEGNINIIIEKGITSIGTNTFTDMTGTGTEDYVHYYYTGTSTEWASVTGTEGITIPEANFNYTE